MMTVNKKIKKKKKKQQPNQLQQTKTIDLVMFKKTNFQAGVVSLAVGIVK